MRYAFWKIQRIKTNRNLAKLNLMTRYWPLTFRFCTRRLCKESLEPTWIVFVFNKSRTELSTAYFLLFFNRIQKITQNRKVDWSKLLLFEFLQSATFGKTWKKWMNVLVKIWRTYSCRGKIKLYFSHQRQICATHTC